ncbi:hypothetical protein V8E54_007282 [Elaphomyces granulatus]
MPKAMVAGNTISSISSGKSTLGLTIPNAILARNLGLSFALQVVNTLSISAGSGGVGAISGRETCVWVSHYTLEMPRAEPSRARRSSTRTNECVMGYGIGP